MNFGLLLKKLADNFNTYLKIQSYAIVSLGPNCYPKTVLVRHGLLKRKKFGQPTYPFDLAWFHSAKYITEFLKSDFKNFLTELRYSDYSKSWDNGNKINFSHEAYLSPNQKNELIRIYNKRIKNFRNEMQQSRPILFLQILKDEKIGQDCKNTYGVLKKLCKDRKFVYVVIDCINKTSGIILPKKIHVLRLNLPNKEVDVFSKNFYESKEGIDFEKSIISCIEEVIYQEFQVKPIKYHFF